MTPPKRWSPMWLLAWALMLSPLWALIAAFVVFWPYHMLLLEGLSWILLGAIFIGAPALLIWHLGVEHGRSHREKA